MAFDFGAALSSAGQIGPAMTEGAELRRQRLDAARQASERSQAAADTHLAREAQTERERALTAQDTRTASRYTPISSKPERGEDGKYYMLFLSPENKIQRLPVEGSYDPNAEKYDTLKKLNIPLDSELAKQYLTGVKPVAAKSIWKQDSNGQWREFREDPLGGAPQEVPVLDAQGKPLQGKMPATSTTSTSDYHWVDNQGQVHATPSTRTTTRRYGGQVSPSTSPPASNVPRGTSTSPRPSSAPTGLSKGDRIIGTGKLPAAAEKIVITTQPVIDQTDRIIKRIEALGLQGDNTSGYLAKDYLKYKMGSASDAGSLGNDIAALSLGSVVDAASALSGSSRSLPALRIAMQHTPNPWIDSPKLLHEKLMNINSRLHDMVNEAKTAGNAGASQGAHQKGDTVQYRGRPATILAINPDGTYQLDVK